MLTDDQGRHLRTLMVAERERLLAQEAAMGLTFDELVAAADLEPPDDEHDPDGTTAYERAQVSSLRSLSERGVASLDAALAALAAGTYGTCVVCGVAIPYDRLTAIVGTDRCLACAAGRT